MGALAVILFILLLLGVVPDPVGIILITMPVFLAVVDPYGWNPIWFGVASLS